MQMALDQGVAMVETKIANRPDVEAEAPPPEPEDDGHVETVEEVKLKMAKAQETMNAGLAAADQRAAQAEKESAMMPAFGALATMTDTIHSMGHSQAQRQVNLLAARLGVAVQAGDEKLGPEALSSTMIKRARALGKSEKEIEEDMQEVE